MGRTNGLTEAYSSVTGEMDVFVIASLQIRVTLLVSAWLFSVGCWNRDIPVPWNDPLAVVALGL